MNLNWLAQHRFQCLHFHHDLLPAPGRRQLTDPVSTLLYIIAGRARLTVNLTDHIIQPGMILAIPRGVWYRLATLEPLEYFWVRYRLWLATGQPIESRVGLPMVLTPNNFAAIVRELQTIERWKKNKGDPGRILVEGLAHALILRHVTACRLEQSAPINVDPRAWRVRTLLLSCFTGPYKGKFLAQRAGLSHAQMFRLFRRHFHDTPKAFWNRERLKTIKRELRANTLAMSEIGDKYGFADLSHFTRWFKILAGQTPSQYRNG